MQKINKEFSAREKGKLNAKRIHDWLSTRPVVPIYHGQVNKTAICKMHKIPKSTTDTNPELKKLFAPDGPIEKLAIEQRGGKANIVKSSSSEKVVYIDDGHSNSELVEQIETLKVKLNSIRTDLASEEFLLATGRYIPRLYDHLKDE